VRAGAGKTAGGVVRASAGDPTRSVVRRASRKTAGGVVRASARDSAGSVVRVGARDGAACGVRAGESASGGRTVTVTGRGETAVVRVYARVDLVSHVGGVGTRGRVGTVGVGGVGGGVAGTVGLVDVRVTSQAAVRTGQAAGAVGSVGGVAGTVGLVVGVASQARVRACDTVRAGKARVRACNTAVRAGHPAVRTSQTSAVRAVAVRTMALVANRKATSGGNRVTVLHVCARAADETAGLNTVVVESVRFEAAAVVVGEGVRVSVGVSRVAVRVAVVARVRVDPRIELVEHVRLMWAHCLVVLHLLRLGVDSRVCDIGGVAGMRAQGVRCRASRAVILPCAVWARSGAVQGSVGVRGGAGVRLTAAEVGVARRSAQGSSRGAVAGSVAARAHGIGELTVAAAHSTEVAPVRVDSGIGAVGHVRGVRS
jgi:hypothetical protein